MTAYDNSTNKGFGYNLHSDGWNSFVCISGQIFFKKKKRYFFKVMLKTSFIYLSFLIKENYRPKPLLLKINLCKPVSMGFYCWWSVPVPVITIVTICLAVIITDSICSIKSTSGAMQWLGVVIKSLFFFFLKLH